MLRGLDGVFVERSWDLVGPLDVALAGGTIQIVCRRLKSDPASAEGGSNSPGVEHLNQISPFTADSAFSKPLRARVM